MKKYILFFLIGVFHYQISYGQNPLVKQWDKRFGGLDGESLLTILQASEGGFFLAGNNFSGIGGDKSQANNSALADYWIVKTDSLGIKIWDRVFGGTGFDFLYSAQITSDGGLILGGFSRSGISGDKTQANCDTTGFTYDYWVIKMDSLGNKQWDKDFGGAVDDELFSIQQTSDGGYVLAGISFSGIGGDKTQSNWDSSGLTCDYWVVKIDSVGNKLWDKVFGGTGSDLLYSVLQTIDGGYILGGYSNSGISGDKSQLNWGNDGDFWIVKIDSLGNKQWDKDFGGTGDERLFSMDNTTDGGYILGGISNSDISGNKSQNCWSQSYDFWILKIDSNGNIQWDQDFGGINNEDEFGNISQTSDKGYLIAGTSYSNISGDKTENNLGPEQSWIVKTDSLGNKKWDKTLHTNSQVDVERGLAIEINDGCYLMGNYTAGGIAGDKSQNSWGGYPDFWIIKFCDTSLVKPEIILYSSDTIFCGKQCLDFYDLSANSPTSWQWLFPGADSTSSNQQNPTGICYNSYGTFDVTLIACNASGCDTLYLPNFIHELQNPAVPIVTWIADTLFSTPSYSYQWYFNSNMIPGATNQYYIFHQPGNYFVIVTDSNGCATSSAVIYTGIDEPADGNSNIYAIPNPSDGSLILYGAKVKSVVKIYDVAGRVFYLDKIKSSPERLHFEAVDGIYFIEIFDFDRLTRLKIILKN